MKEYTVKEFVAATGKSNNIIRHQIRKGFLKTRIKNMKTIIIQYKGDPKKYVNKVLPARTTYEEGSKKGLLTFVKRNKDVFICDCDCGKRIEIRRKLFYGGNSKTLSCGCNKDALEAAKSKNKPKTELKPYLNDIDNDLLFLCRKFRILGLLDLDKKTFDGRDIEISERQYIFKDNEEKLIRTIYKKYGYKRLSFQEELVRRRK